MNKFFKIIVAVLGAVNVVFSMFIPISIALILISFLDMSVFNVWAIMILGFLSSFFRAIKFWVNE